eukprot:scaffold167376_cov30-Tisochrysis_lutea.AAC.1
MCTTGVGCVLPFLEDARYKGSHLFPGWAKKPRERSTVHEILRTKWPEGCGSANPSRSFEAKSTPANELCFLRARCVVL